MLLKFLAKQWLNDEPLPARGKRAEGTILTEIRRAPPRLFCDAPRILRAPYCETRIIDVCYTPVFFRMESIKRDDDDERDSVLLRKVNFIRSIF